VSHAHFWCNRRLVAATSTRGLLLASLTQLYFCSGVTLAYEPFFTGSQIAYLVSSLADAIEAESLDRDLKDCAASSRIVALTIDSIANELKLRPRTRLREVSIQS